MEHGNQICLNDASAKKMDWFESVILFKDTLLFHKASQQIEIMHEGDVSGMLCQLTKLGAQNTWLHLWPRPHWPEPQIHSIINA